MTLVCRRMMLTLQGMFLYARVIINTLRMLNGFEEMRQELRVPPEDLNEA